MMRMLSAPLAALLLTSACASDAPLVLPVPIERESSPFVYPEELWDEGVEGQAVVMLHVTPDGTVDSVYVRATSGYESMDTAALRGARELRFQPGRRGADAVDVWVRLPVRFTKSPPQPDEDAGQVTGTGDRT